MVKTIPFFISALRPGADARGVRNVERAGPFLALISPEFVENNEVPYWTPELRKVEDFSAPSLRK